MLVSATIGAASGRGSCRRCSGPEFLKIGAASAEDWRTFAQKRGALCGKNILERLLI
jgi:hypothetical protein